MSKWVQLWAMPSKETTGDAVHMMKICEPLLMRFGAVPCAPDGIPVKSADGSIEVRVYNASAVSLVKRVLEDYGFEVVREKEND